MNLFFARACIAVCGFSIPFMVAGQMWVLTPFLLGLIGILYYASINKNSPNH